MHWIGLGMLAVAVVGCGPAVEGGEEDPAETFRAPLPRMEPFDYGTCEIGAVVVDCADGSCVEDGTEELFDLFMLAVETYELEDYVFVSDVEADEISGDLRLAYQIHVGWLRAGNEIRLELDASYDDKVEAIEEAIGDLDLPLTLAEPAQVVQELVDCVPQVDFDHCTAFASPREASVTYFVNQGGLVEWRARVDTKTGGVIQCGVD